MLSKARAARCGFVTQDASQDLFLAGEAVSCDIFLLAICPCGRTGDTGEVGIWASSGAGQLWFDGLTESLPQATIAAPSTLLRPFGEMPWERTTGRGGLRKGDIYRGIMAKKSIFPLASFVV